MIPRTLALALLLAACGGGDDDGGPIDAAPSAPLLAAAAATPITTEAGGTATLDVSLGRAPVANVIVEITSNDVGEGTIGTARLTFTPEAWTPQALTGTGVDDYIDDGDVAYTLTVVVLSSADPEFAALAPLTVNLTNRDDDTAAIVPLATAPTTSEAGGTATFTVALGAMPTADVLLSLTVADAGEGTVAPAMLTFTPAAWQTPQTVTVTGVDDLIDDGDQSFDVTLAPTSFDPAFSGLSPVAVAVVNTDDDTAAVTVTPTTLSVTETATATFTVVLATEPTASVTIPLSTSSATESTVSPASLAFTPTNWQTPQTVTVAGTPDVTVEGPGSSTIVVGRAVSADLAYNALDPADVAVTTVDLGRFSSCAAMHTWVPAAGDGFYELLTGGVVLNVYCDMTRNGGGWTLVLLNSPYGTPITPTWSNALYANNVNGAMTDLTTFDQFLGVSYWMLLGSHLRLDQGNGPGDLQHSATYDYSFSGGTYTLTMSNEVLLLGTDSAGMLTYHAANHHALSTYDSDHDTHPGICSSFYGNTAWWYGDCWSGSFWGGGTGGGYTNNPYWTGSSADYHAWGAIWVK